MNKPKLYYFIGYPGAGKTTLAKLIAEHGNAIHIWADDERHHMFPEATHSKEESVALYDFLNEKAEKLLSESKNVVFDTNFNFYSDRELMREMAKRQNAEAILIWLDAPREISKSRAVCLDKVRNGYTVSMTSEQFDVIADKLEPPKDNEKYIRIDSTNIDHDKALSLFGLK